MASAVAFGVTGRAGRQITVAAGRGDRPDGAMAADEVLDRMKRHLTDCMMGQP